MATAPLLTATATGDVLELRPGGSWIAANVATLERFPTPLRRSSTAPDRKLDMAGVRELDTLGAWLLEKMSRRATSAGHRADVIGVADNYAGLIEEVRQVNRRNARADPGAQSAIVAKVERYRPLRRSARREDVTAFLEMLGSLCIAHARRAAPAAVAAADVAGLSALPGRLAGDPDHRADHLSDRRHHRAAGDLPFPQIRRRFLRRRYGRHSGAARTRRPDRRHHGRRSLRQRLHRRARLDEDARGNRCAFDHGA